MNHRLSARQANRPIWSHDRLVQARAVALGFALEPSSRSSYSSALQSYLSFCHNHDFPIEPTPNSLSLYVAYMSHHIKPRSVKSYLSGICNQLESFYPNVREVRCHKLVVKTLLRVTKLRAILTVRKWPLLREELASVSASFSSSTSHDDKLFLSILLTSFHGLMRLGFHQKCKTASNPPFGIPLLPHLLDRCQTF